MFNYIKCRIKSTNSQNKEVLSKKEYEFINFLEDIDVGDWIITECSNGYQIGKVTQIYTDGTDATAYVLGKIDNSMIPQWTRFHNKYNETYNKIEDRASLFSNRMKYYEFLAKDDVYLRNLLCELNKLLDGGNNGTKTKI